MTTAPKGLEMSLEDLIREEQKKATRPQRAQKGGRSNNFRPQGGINKHQHGGFQKYDGHRDFPHQETRTGLQGGFQQHKPFMGQRDNHPQYHDRQHDRPTNRPPPSMEHRLSFQGMHGGEPHHAPHNFQQNSARQNQNILQHQMHQPRIPPQPQPQHFPLHQPPRQSFQTSIRPASPVRQHRPVELVPAPLECICREDTGEVVVKLKSTEIVTVTPTGTVSLTTSGWFTRTMFEGLNSTLELIGMKVIADGAVTDGNWSISDGRSVRRFTDGMVMPAKGMLTANRGQRILTGFQNTDLPFDSVAHAATAASTAAAMAAGVYPGSAYGYRHGMLPGYGADGDDVGNGEGLTPQDPDAIRRLKAQGRYLPY